MNLRPALLIMLLSACGTPPTTNPAAADAAPIERAFTVAPGQFVEANLRLPADSEARGHFEASGAVTWNTHSHPGGEVVVHSQGVGQSGDLVLNATSADVYSMLWENRTESALELRVVVQLPAGAGVHSWHPE